MERLQLGSADPAQSYPRPMLQRDGWASLNGPWSFALDREGSWTWPGQVVWDERQILVPFAPETSASGIHDTGFYSVCWYKRPFVAPDLGEAERLILHFGAVDYEATVGSTTQSSRSTAVATRLSRSTSRASSWPAASMSSRCAPTMILTISPSRAASRIGSSSLTRSGTAVPPGSGRRYGSKSCLLPGLCSC